MKLHEYQAKALLSMYGMLVPRSGLASTPQEAAAVAARLGKPCVVKAQIHASGRGKAGGVRLTNTPD
jgi:succinyl-CoA synthetase beta subunit